MSVTYKHEWRGADYCQVNHFDKTGDTIPPHVHTEKAYAHNVTCLKGSVGVAVAYRNGWGQSHGTTRVLLPGETFNLDWWELHWITALEPDSETSHKYINGQPDIYRTLPASELVGEYK